MTDEIYLTYAERVQKLSDIFNPRTRVITSCGLVGIADAATSYAENVEAIRELRSETVVNVRSVVKAGERQNRFALTAPVDVMELYSVHGDKTAFRRR